MTSSELLGRLVAVKPRDIWPHEAQDFTPWLLKNSVVLSDLLGMELVLEAAEHPVGGFWLDLIGRDEATGERVIVENQLEESDHSHLGQILTYAAGTEATSVVWIATRFRAEHRAALDWLNERTGEDTRFFGVEIHVVRIGDSQPAPAFKLIAQPNDWGKQVKIAAKSAGMTELERQYQDFWVKFSEAVKSTNPTWTQATSSKASWFAMSAGEQHVRWVFAFTKLGLAVYLEFGSPDPEVNEAKFKALHAQRDSIEHAFGAALIWDAKDGNKSTKIATYTSLAKVTSVDQLIS
ncbi:DUF4268 domain-containing protein [Rhodoglobus aureus]|uniref:DUF4268 domain-containing protein n=1 Tax=Rhodoglobus aureus TaxID=191497 RepID=A0ABN1VEK2_9MICO